MANGINWDALNRLVGIGVMTSAIIRGASAGTPTASARRGGLAPAIVAAVAAGLQGMAVAALLGGMSAAKAENYPTRAIRLLVGFPAGGPADIPARAVAGKLAEALGTPVVVENKPGAGGLLATQDLLEQSPDGHTLLLCTYFDPVSTLLYRKARYKISDVAPISLIATYDYVLATANTVPAGTVAQLIELTRANPERFNYGHIGIASPANLIFKQLERLTGMKMTAVPFKGSAPAIQEVMAGRLDLYIVPPISAVQPYDAKQIKVLAATGQKRLPALPGVPTLNEAGVPIVSFAFLGVCAASGTPEPIIQKLNRLIADIVKSADYQQLITKLGSVPVASSPGEFQAVMDAAVRDATPIVTEFKLQMD
jgi:tripartite-type tricarboxylate transporter receptor subunit TctC